MTARFVTDVDTLAHLRTMGDDAGLVLGADSDENTVVLPLFRPGRGTTVAVVGNTSVAKVVTYRSLALGARVVVETRRPGIWRGLTTDVGLPRTTLAVVPPNGSASGAGSPNRPRLRVMDVGASSRMEASMVQPDPAAGGWSCRLLVLEDLEAADVTTLSAADVLVLSSVTVDQAESLVGLMDEAGAARLSRLRTGAVLVVGSGGVRDVELAWTVQEQAMLAVD